MYGKGTLWNSTQNILPMLWKMCSLFKSEDLRAPRFMSSKVFLKRPPEAVMTQFAGTLVYHQRTVLKMRASS